MNVLVTGGLQGIGRAIVDRYKRDGHTVFVFDVALPDDERVQALQKHGVWYYTVDVRSLSFVKEGFKALHEKLQEYAHKELDVLVNNAGVTRDSLALRLTEEEWNCVLDTNLKGSFFCAQQALLTMVKQKRGYIINISSVVGLHGNAGQVAYAASKAGMIGMAKTLAREYGKRNIMVNAIAPGFITTSMTNEMPEEHKKHIQAQCALRRLGEPEDVASLVGFLTSGHADYITGEVIEISGGLSM